GWIGDHRGELAIGGNFPIQSRLTRELADSRSFLDEFDFELQQVARFDGLAEFHPVDRHEVDELARAGEAEAFDREYAGCLRERFDLKHPRHDRATGKVSLKVSLVD